MNTESLIKIFQNCIKLQAVSMVLMIVMEATGLPYLKLDPILLEWHQTYLEQDLTQKDMIILPIVLVYLGLIIWNYITLWKFKSYSRKWFMYILVSSLPLTLFSGPYVDNGFATMLISFMSIITGVMVALIYYTPLEKLFTK